MKKPSTTIGTGEANMWWAHTSVARNAITAVDAGDRLVAEDRLTREHRDDLGDDPEPGQDHDVDLWVPEEPE